MIIDYMRRAFSLINMQLCVEYAELHSQEQWCSHGGGGCGGWGLESLFSGKYDVIFSYIFTNTTKLVLHLSCLDCFSNAFY